MDFEKAIRPLGRFTPMLEKVPQAVRDAVFDIRISVDKPVLLCCGDRILFLREDGDTAQILGRPVTFFDIHSTGSAKQFGFAMEYSAGKVFACSGDEPLTSENFSHVEVATWLVLEAYCRHDDIERYNPHPIHHGTVREACATAEHLSVENLVLYHTEDDDLAHRKERYLAEGRSVYGGNLHVPDDLEAFEL